MFGQKSLFDWNASGEGRWRWTTFSHSAANLGNSFKDLLAELAASRSTFKERAQKQPPQLEQGAGCFEQYFLAFVMVDIQASTEVEENAESSSGGDAEAMETSSDELVEEAAQLVDQYEVCASRASCNDLSRIARMSSLSTFPFITQHFMQKKTPMQMDPLRPLQSKEAILLRSKARKLALMQKYVEAAKLQAKAERIEAARRTQSPAKIGLPPQARQQEIKFKTQLQDQKLADAL
ncbi:unnamed protein product, partial [Effrenium voratum]